MTSPEHLADPYWIFPPALNLTIVANYSRPVPSSNKTLRGVSGLVSDVVSNLTLAERYANSDANSGFGSNDTVPRVGDAIEVDWKGGCNRTLSLNCVVCTSGPEGGLIEHACNNYTRLANSYNKYNISQSLAPGSAYNLPSLEGYFPLEDANRTCALCIVNLLEEDFMTANWSIPFPVLQQSTYPHKRFSAEHPTGIEDPSIRLETSSPLSEPATTNDDTKINVGMVVGVVVGVLLATVLFAMLYWWIWKKRKGAAKVVDSGASSTAERDTAGADRSAQSIALRRIQGVVRRPDTSTSEVPPAYHEAVRHNDTP